MKRFLPLLIPLLVLAGCGGESRATLARQTEQAYWNDIHSAKLDKAYQLLTPGTKSQFSANDFRQSMFNFLQHTSGVTAQVKKVSVVGDCAQVSLDLISPLEPSGKFHVYQHLYWIDGGWHISDQNATLSQKYVPLTSCPTGA